MKILPDRSSCPLTASSSRRGGGGVDIYLASTRVEGPFQRGLKGIVKARVFDAFQLSARISWPPKDFTSVAPILTEFFVEIQNQLLAWR